MKGNRGRQAVASGPTAATVAANVHRLRRSHGLSIYELSDRLREAGRPITKDGVSRIERGERQVSVDELMTLSAVLGTSPSALLLPLTDDPNSQVEVTGVGAIPADEAWDWVDGRRRLDQPCSDLGAADLEYAIYSRPPLRRNREIGRRET